MQDTEPKIIDIIKKNFPNGVRADFIDANKIFRLYAANYHEEISRDKIIETICKNGVENGGRYYFISSSKVEELQKLFAGILEKNSIAYYSEIYEKHSDFFARLQIFSIEVLKDFLPELNDGNFYFGEFCAANESAWLELEISKIFASTEKPVSLETLQKNFPYVPAKKILEVLSKKYLPIEGGYFPISKLQFDTEEIDAAKNRLLKILVQNNYATFDNCDLSSNFELNPEVSEKNLRDVIFKKFFAVDFDKRGNRIFKKGSKNNVSYFMPDLRKFVSTRQELSTDELFNFAESLGTTTRHIPLNAANELMIRVEKNFFVKDALIHFDVEGIDAALNSFVQGKIIPLRAVTSFTGFPAVGAYTWNLFLLESFLRRFSKKYSLMAAGANVNNSNAGAIFPNSLKFKDYLDLQVAAVIQEKIPLEKSAVENFLVEQGYRVTKTDKTTNEIISEIARRQEKI